MSEPPVVLDATALLALLQQEPGADRVAGCLPQAVISAVNLAEVVAKLADHGIAPARAQTTLGGLDLDVRDFDAAMGYAAGALRQATHALGLALGERACLALAASLRGVAMTADRAWARLAPDIARVEVIR